MSRAWGSFLDGHSANLFILVIAPVFIGFAPRFGVGDAERAAQLVGERHGAEQASLFKAVDVGQVAKTVEAKTVQESFVVT